MSSPDEFDVKSNHRILPRTVWTINMLVGLAQNNPDKALVMTYIGQLVVAGHVEVELLDNGEVEARFASGETYILAETTILRVA
ncbi:hypothetical protein GOZ90_24460 [Agrobacterium vitis]|uniref:Uncharacterized protein n=1 Tax=Agrobacterium vitis TaxID=373 RepID=A0A6L6VJ11_AGRVI|nr:hypothetical protein [Agrobacterium vitis]MUZ75823.1 hypothetical protein [Agrobacterium vitis]MVA19909.1 hypothetical protein [Agrobacterium vitis]